MIKEFQYADDIAVYMSDRNFRYTNIIIEEAVKVIDLNLDRI